MSSHQRMFPFTLATTLACAGCMKNVCDDDVSHTSFFGYIQRPDLAQRQAQNTPEAVWYWCEVPTVTAPPQWPWSDVFRIVNLYSGDSAGVGGWVRVDIDEAAAQYAAHHAVDPWRRAASAWFAAQAVSAGVVFTGEPLCYTCREISDMADMATSCDTPATRSPATAGSTTDPLPTGTVPGGGDK
jgi:hypothetical protein